MIDERGVVDLDDDSKTENARGVRARADPERAPVEAGRAPRNVVFLTADAFGILPPIARLTAEQARAWSSSRGSRRSSPGPRSASPSRSRRSPPASARRSCRSAGGLRNDARRQAGRARRDRLARQHRLDRRPVRRESPHADQGDAGAPHRRGALRLAARRRVPRRRSSASTSRSRFPPAWTRRCSTRDRRGRPECIRREGSRARRDVPRELRCEEFAAGVDASVATAGPRAT